MVELTVIIKDEEKRLAKKYLIYEPFVCVEHDPMITDCIEELLKDFASEPDHININIKMCVK